MHTLIVVTLIKTIQLMTEGVIFGKQGKGQRKKQGTEQGTGFLATSACSQLAFNFCFQHLLPRFVSIFFLQSLLATYCRLYCWDLVACFNFWVT